MHEWRVLVVEDEQKIAALLCDYLQQAGFSTHWISDGDEVVGWIRQNAPDIVLLDVMLPGTDGLTLCKDIRGFSSVPIIMVTARVEEIDRLLGLELGADDYVCKPFSTREVVARVKAIMRRVSAQQADTADSYRGLKVNVEGHAITYAGDTIVLTPVEFRILELLVRQPGRVHSRSALIDKMYTDGRVVSDRTVDSHVKNLRKKLVSATGDKDWIRSVYGIGYRID